MNALAKAAIVAATGVAITASPAKADMTPDRFLEVAHAYGFYPGDGWYGPNGRDEEVAMAGNEVCVLADADYSQKQIIAAMVSVGAANTVSAAADFVGISNETFCPTLNIGALEGRDGPVSPDDLDSLGRIRQHRTG